jgi:MFS family permease
MVISAISTALCPLMAALGYIPFIIVRVIQGFGFLASFPVIGAILLEWPRAVETGLFIGVLSGFIQVRPKFLKF